MTTLSSFYHGERTEKYKKPQLQLVFAEDDEDWVNKIWEYLEGQIHSWPIFASSQSKFSQFEFNKPIICDNLEDFRTTTGRLVAEGFLVYATLDLNMPRREGEEPEDITESLVESCFDLKEKSAADELFEFCIISGSDNALERLEKNPELSAKLQRWGVNQVRKDALINSFSGLKKIADDIKSMLIKNIEFCVYPLSMDEEEGDEGLNFRAIWSGGNAALTKLLALADRVATKKEKGLFLLFADALGYEQLWYELICYFCQEEPFTINCDNTPEAIKSCLKDYRNNGYKSILIRNIHKVKSRAPSVWGRINKLIKESISEKETLEKAVYIHFPYGENQLNITKRLSSEDEQDLLWQCIDIVYRKENSKENPPVGVGFAFPEHEKVIPFPHINELGRLDVTRETIGVLEQLCWNIYGLKKPAKIDPELKEVLSEASWQDQLELSNLQEKIITALKNKEGLVTVDQLFDDVILGTFNEAQGLRIRGRMLYYYLKEGSSIISGAPTKSALSKPINALKGLEIILDLFHRLQSLVMLRNSLEMKNPFGNMFDEAHYISLEHAYEFLKSLFIKPEQLEEKVNDFRENMDDPDWIRSYPSLRVRDDWQELVKRIKFDWPFDHLPLHPEIGRYLDYSEVITELRMESEGVLSLYSDLKSDLDRIEESYQKEKEKIQDKLQKREQERKRAERFVREDHGQPSLLHFQPPNVSQAGDARLAVQSFITFNSYVAISENAQRFNKGICTGQSLEEKLVSDLVWPKIETLIMYLDALRGSARGNESVFRHWVDDWPLQGKTPDVTRLIQKVAHSILMDFGDYVQKPHFKDILKEMAVVSEDECTIGTFLQFLGIIHRCFLTENEMFWAPHKNDIFDILRRFVLATTRKDLFLQQFRPKEGASKRWSFALFKRNEGSVAEFEEVEHEVWVCRLSESDGLPEQLFPLSDLIRFNPVTYSVWAWTANDDNRWVNLTNVKYAKETTIRYPEHTPWLPNSSYLSLETDSRICYGKNTSFLIEPIPELAEGLINKKKTEGVYDVFISYNSLDREHVVQVAQMLVERGIWPWLDIWRLKAGDTWRAKIGQDIDNIKSAAICFGENFTGKCQQEEIDVILEYFNEKQSPIIPVLLPKYNPEKKLPVWLSQKIRVDLKEYNEKELGKLIRGITSYPGD